MVEVTEITASIEQLATALAAIAAALVSIQSWRQSRLNTKKLDKAHDAVNGRVDELIALRESIAYKRGLEDKVAQDKHTHERGG